ncbi:MAG: diguanylate cyclase domain-containing protein [Janthinobacterium lividum]
MAVVASTLRTGLSIRVRILIACLLLTILTITLGVMTLRGQDRLGGLALRMYDQAFMSVDFFRTAQLDFMALRAISGDPQSRPELQTQALRVVDDLDIAIERATSQDAHGIATELRAIVLALALNPSSEPRRELMRRAAEAFERGSEQFAQDGFAFRQQAEQVAHDSQTATRVAIGASLAAAVLITFSLTRSIVPPLRRATSIATEIARGNLRNEIRPKGTIEMITLLDALRSMQNALVERQLIAEQIEYLALHDVLTGLANRLEFGKALEAAGNSKLPFALLLIDLDHFKPVNDTFGHAIGDRVLQAVAKRFSRCVGDCDVVARLGGDEFAILLLDSREPQAEELARCVIEATMRPFELEHRQIRIGCSIGICCCDGVLVTENLLRDADDALYAAKASGRNAFRSHREHGTLGVSALS